MAAGKRLDLVVCKIVQIVPAMPMSTAVDEDFDDESGKERERVVLWGLDRHGHLWQFLDPLPGKEGRYGWTLATYSPSLERSEIEDREEEC